MIRFVQGALAQLGYRSGAVDGVAGPATRAAVRAYQRKLGLPDNGVIDLALIEIVEADRAER
jgi:peptidoglycan hydrolase-like protein with peptidoglycan-binding domain